MRITEAFLGEHAVFYSQFDECSAALHSADLPALQQLAAVIASALVPHAQLENELLFDELDTRDVPPALLSTMRDEHHFIDDGLTRIRSARDAATARALWLDVIAAARAHFEKEEQVLFPLAERTLELQEQMRLGRRWAAARGVSLE